MRVDTKTSLILPCDAYEQSIVFNLNNQLLLAFSSFFRLPLQLLASGPNDDVLLALKLDDLKTCNSKCKLLSSRSQCSSIYGSKLARKFKSKTNEEEDGLQRSTEKVKSDHSSQSISMEMEYQKNIAGEEGRLQTNSEPLTVEVEMIAEEPSSQTEQGKTTMSFRNPSMAIPM